MRIGIFVTMAGRKAGGIESYEHNLIRALAHTDRNNQYHIFCTDKTAADSFQIQQGNFHFHPLRPRARWISIPFSLPLQVRSTGCQLLHCTYIPPLWSPVPSIFTIHDMSVFDHPNFYHLRHRKVLQTLQSHGGRHANLNICVSKTTQEIAIQWLKIPERQTTVVYLGVNEIFHPIPQKDAHAYVRSTYNVDTPYALYVGQLRSRHKNLFALLEAFALFREKITTPFKLLLVGKRSWTTEGLDETIERLGLKDHIMECGHVPEKDLPYLYAGANMFVFPTLSEGFGLSVCEAMACGTPVITSNLSCLPEITGGAAYLVDPHSPQAIAKAMIELQNDQNLREQFIAKGIQRVKTFTWEATARQTIEAYRQVIQCPENQT
ncbi:MAG: glycosyltransferase family 4 protein [Gammaproteobacteria bacterium]|nr:glycosyltransferase family 4 protein [Gammaproteobacteria bacterium]